MGKLVSISLCFFLKNLEICRFLLLVVLLTRLWVPKMTLIQSHKFSPIDSVPKIPWDFYYIIHSYPSDSMGLMPLTWNISFIIGGDSPFKNLNISVAKVWIFLWWILKEPSFSTSSSKLALKSECTILNAFSWNLFFFFIAKGSWMKHLD